MEKYQAVKRQVIKGQDGKNQSIDVPYIGVFYRVGKRIGGPGDEKIYYVTYKIDGKKIEESVGRQYADHMTPAKASRIRSDIIEGRRLPKKEKVAKQKKEDLETNRQNVTLKDAWPIYIEARKHLWSERHLADHIRVAHAGGAEKKRGKGKTEPGALAALMDCKLSDLTPGKVRDWLQTESQKRSTQARIAFDALRAFINWADEKNQYKGLASLDACSRRIKKENLPKKQAKDDCLQREQLKVWFNAVQGLSNPVISAYLQGLLLTGARREELAGLQWEDVNFRWQAMTIRDKVEGERTIPLTPHMAYLLNSLPRRNQWVFSSPGAKSGRIQEPRIPHNRALAVAGIPDLTLHGLRRSFGTLSEWIEVPAGIVAQIQGHKPSATAEKHYRKRPIDLLRMWHVKIEKWLLEQAGLEQPAADDQQVLKVVNGGK